MHAFKLLCCTGLLATITAHAAPGVEITVDGAVKVAGKVKKQLALHAIASTFRTENGIYLDGYLGPKNELKQYAIGWLAPDLQQEKVWPRPDFVADFFVWQKTMHFLAADGRIHVLRNAQWQATAWQTTAGAVVVHGAPALIVCHARGAEKLNTTEGGCESPTHGWRREIAWHMTTPPSMCAGRLMVVERGVRAKPDDMLLTLDPLTGKELGRKAYRAAGAEKCR